MPDIMIPASTIQIPLPGESAVAVAARAARDAAIAAAGGAAVDAADVEAARAEVASNQADVAANTVLAQDAAALAVPAAAAAVPAAVTATTKAAEAAAARDAAVVAVGSGRLRKATLAELNAALDYPADAVGEVDSDGANNGQYVKVGASGTGSWARTSTATVNSLGQVIGDANTPDDLLAAFTSRDATGGREVYAYFADQGRRWVAAGLITQASNDGSVQISDSRGALVSVAADGVATFRGALRGTDQDISDGALVVFRQPDGLGAGFRADGNGALRLMGMAEPTIIVSDDGLASSSLLVFRQPDGAGAAFAPDTNGRLALLGSPEIAVTPKPHQIEAYGLKGDGSDESTALMAAHDAAQAAGVRVLDLGSMQINAPSATKLGNVIFTGQKQLVGTYQKRVIPPVAPSLQMRSGVVPRHLTAFAAAASPVVVVMGDSTSAAAESMHRPSIGLWGAITRKLARDNPHKSPVFHNRAVSGTTVAMGDTVPASNFPSWYTDTGRAWLLYVQDLAPDVLLLNWGENDNTADILTPLLSVISKVQAWAKVPNLVFCTNLRPTTQYTTYGSRANQDRRDANSGFIRSFARRNGYGLIDFSRQFSAARDGFDPLDVRFQRVQNEGTISLPFTFPGEGDGYIFDFRNGGGMNAYLTGGAVLAIPLSAQADNAILLRISGGFWQYRVQTRADRVIVPWTSTSFSGAERISGSIHPEGYCTIELDNTIVWQGYAERYGGLYAPRIGLQGSEASYSVTLLQAAVAVPRIVAPSVTDLEAYGLLPGQWPSSNGFDGSGINHMSAAGCAAVYYPAVEATNFAT